MELTNFNSRKQKNFFLGLALVITFFLIIILENAEQRIPILGFHGVIDPLHTSPSVQAVMDYPKQDLENLLEYLVLHNYWFLTTQDLNDYFLTKSKKIPEERLHQKPIMISFDDGYKTVYTNLIPILQKLEEKYTQKVKVVLFVNPGTLAKQHNIASIHLDCEDLRAGLKQGFYDIQSHGENHKKLTRLNSKNLVNELLQAQIELRQCTKDLDPEQKVASHLAYPYGAYNQQVKSSASKYYLSSYQYNNQVLNYNFFKKYYEIPRLTINRQNSAQKLIEMLEKSF